MILATVLFILAFAAIGHSYPRHGFRDQCANHWNSYTDFDRNTFYEREEWGALPPVEVTNLNLPVSMVIIHHTYEPDACYSRQECTAAMRSMQSYHQETRGWSDIGYNFAVGGDGEVYEGRGWKAVGAHAAGFNTLSIGIVLIGNWVSEVPPEYQLEVTRRLISAGVESGYISPDYSLIGHRQVRSTECPGEALFQEISTWNRFRTETKDV